MPWEQLNFDMNVNLEEFPTALKVEGWPAGVPFTTTASLRASQRRALLDVLNRDDCPIKFSGVANKFALHESRKRTAFEAQLEDRGTEESRICVSNATQLHNNAFTDPVVQEFHNHNLNLDSSN